MTDRLVCWKCAEPLLDNQLPIRREDVCQVCRAPLHVCRMCRNYDPRLTDQCRHDRADRIVEKEYPNFCAFFRPRRNANESVDATRAARSRSELESLFGAAAEEVPDDLTVGDVKRGEKDAARSALDELFGGGEKK